MAEIEGANKRDGVMSPVTSYVSTVTASLGNKVPVDAANARRVGQTTELSAEASQIRGAGPDAWFGPMQPMQPFAPPGTGGRAWDYPFGLNLLYTPRGESEIPFSVLRAFADALPDLRIAIEHRKAEVAAWQWDIQPILTGKDKRKAASKPPADDPRVADVKKYFRKPDKRHHFALWLGALIEDMLVVDAACIYPRYTFGGDLFSLDLVDGTTIKPLIDETGRQPLPEDGPAYQQILHGVPAADFTIDELMYLPRNIRSGKLYGFSAVEWIILTVNIALRRQVHMLDYYTDGSIPQGFYSVPKEWGPDQIRAFQNYWDDLLSGNLAARRRLQFMPGDGKYTEVKQPPLKDTYDEWLMRIICAALMVSPSAYVNDNTKATAQTIQLVSSQRGVESTKLWIKAVLDDIIQERLGYDDLEYVWSGSDEVDPLEQAQSLQVLISCGVKTVDEGRVELGLDPFGIGPTTQQPVIPLVESYKQSLENIKNPPPPPTLPAPIAQGKGEAETQGKPPSAAPKGTAQPANAKPPAGKQPPAAAKEVGKLAGIPFDGAPSGIEKYSDDQPRDERGRFGSGSGSGQITDHNGKEYEVRHSVDHSGRDVYNVYDPANPNNGYGGHVAGATLRADKPQVSSVLVRPEYQRLGVATALYNHIEEHQGVKLQPNAALTEEGEAFWGARQPAAKYSDDQPRDDHGRWEGSGATYSADTKEWTRAGGGALPEHLAGVKIPPGWTDVKFSENPKSELMVTGRDSKDRPVYLYSDEHWSRVAAEKFARIDEMETKYQSMMAQNEANHASGDERTQAHADALETVAKMGIRPGSEADTGAEKQAYGATTLQGSHVVVGEGGKVSLQFTGKKGVDLNLPVDDKGLADKLTARAAAAGPDGKLFPGVSDASLREYTHTMDGGDFKVKDFRTRLANDVARTSIASRAAPTDAKSYEKAVRAVGKDVSTRLGNTPTVALQSYINPAVFGGWRMGAKL